MRLEAPFVVVAQRPSSFHSQSVANIFKFLAREKVENAICWLWRSVSPTGSRGFFRDLGLSMRGGRQALQTSGALTLRPENLCLG